jgi:ribosomal protein L29
VADLNNYLSSGSKAVKLRDQRDRVREASEDDLRQILQDVQREMLDLRTKAAMQDAANPMRIRAIKKLVARIHTELTARAQKANA